MPRYDIEVQLTGKSGNAGYIIGAVAKALKKNDVSAKEINAFRMQAMSGDYDNVLRTAMSWVEVL
jgi:hypothetical protein